MLVREEGSTWSERTFQGEQAIESRLLPGFQGKVSELWLDAELEDD